MPIWGCSCGFHPPPGTANISLLRAKLVDVRTVTDIALVQKSKWFRIPKLRIQACFQAILKFHPSQLVHSWMTHPKLQDSHGNDNQPDLVSLQSHPPASVIWGVREDMATAAMWIVCSNGFFNVWYRSYISSISICTIPISSTNRHNIFFSGHVNPCCSVTRCPLKTAALPLGA